MNFIAIDFETANNNPESACALGIVQIENGINVFQKLFLIKPPKNTEFNPVNIKINHITPDAVKNEPTFDHIWPEIKSLFETNPVIAHNASFDMNVLTGLFKYYHIPKPNLKYFCTLEIARKTWPGLDSYSLGKLSRHLNIKLDHHNSLSDAQACAQIMLQALEINKNPGIQELDKNNKIFSSKEAINPMTDEQFARLIGAIKAQNAVIDKQTKIVDKISKKVTTFINLIYIFLILWILIAIFSAIV